MLGPVVAAGARTLATGTFGFVSEAGQVGIVVGAGIAVLTLLGLLGRAIVRFYRRADQVQDAFGWVRGQMEANGRAKRAGTAGLTIRETADLTIEEQRAIGHQVESLMAQAVSILELLATLQQGHERLEVNQREQGQKIAGAVRRLDDHLVEANESQRMFETHLAEHEARDRDAET